MGTEGRDETDETAILMRLSDPLRAQMIKDLPEHEGIVVATPGLEHRAMFGVIGSHIDILIRVPARDVRRARKLIAAFDAAPIVDEEMSEPDSEDDDDDGGGEAEEGGDLSSRDEDDDDEPVRESAPPAVSYRESARGARIPRAATVHRSKAIAMFAAVCFPIGGAHLYTRVYPTAALLAVLMLGSLAAIAQGIFLSGLLPFVVAALDAAGGTWHCERSTSGANPERHRWRRFAAEIALAILVGWYFASPHVAGAVTGAPAHAACRQWAACGADFDACIATEADLTLRGHPLGAGCARCIEEVACDETDECNDLCAY